MRRFSVVLLLFYYFPLISTIRICDSISSRLRVVGGQINNGSDFPSQAVLMSYDPDNFGMFCGATVIEDNWILTAAHCIVKDVNRATVMVNVESLSEAQKKFRVRRIYIHPDYDEQNVRNDIALVQTWKSLIRKGVERQCLTDSDTQLLLKGEGIITGFGLTKTSTGVALSDRLESTAVPIIPQTTCRSQWTSLSGGVVQVSTRQLCAGSLLHGTTPGDSGGPLLIQDRQGRMIQVGITSFGASGIDGILDQGAFPGVYTRVSPYIGWIEAVIDIANSSASSKLMLPTMIFVFFFVQYQYGF